MWHFTHSQACTNVSFKQLFLNKVKHIQEKQKKNRMKLDLQAKIENPNILLYAQPHPLGILPFWYRKTRSFNYRSLNINSICNKFEMLSMSVVQYVDILMLSEAFDSTFPSIQFLINDFSVPHRLDWNSKGGGVLLHVRDKIIVLLLNRYSLPQHIEIFFKLNLRNWKWLVCCCYNPDKNVIKDYLRVLTGRIQFY